MERKGYNGKILRVNLTTREISVEEPDPLFYRMYGGGSALGVYYCLKEMPKGTDALAPESVLVFAPSVLTGAAISGVSRFTVTSRSPLAGTIGDAQCGGDWGPELKFSGYDAVVIVGKADKPVYLWLHNGEAEIRDAGGVWGKTTGDTRKAIRAELGDEKTQVACIGPGGEKLVRFANIAGDGSHYAGRTGTGAVMGSKNLKAIACRGKRPYEFADPDTVKALAKKGGENFKNSGFMKILREFGTPGVVRNQANVGNLCTKNFSSGHFDGLENIVGEQFRDKIMTGSETCFGCVVRCKHIVAAEEPFKVDPEYGCPEFETIGLLGSNLLIDDIVAISKGNEICNAYGIDTIAAGAMIAYATESYENGLITKEHTGGLELKFGDGAAMVKLMQLIADRDGIGDTLAEGMPHSVKTFGAATEPFAIHVKGLPFPAHMAQVKMSQALTYAVNPFGADHMSSEHDWLIGGPNEAARQLSLYEKREFSDLDLEKVKLVAYTQMYYSAIDSYTVCAFVWGPDSMFSYRDFEALIRAITGWDMNMWEIMKLGERRINLMRQFNAREGFTSADDKLPERLFTPLPEGISEGRCVKRDEFEAAKKIYYSLMGWDVESGNPTAAKLGELGLAAFAE